jgi:hypothetical protein
MEFEVALMVESLLFGEVFLVTHPADGGPPRLLSQLDYDIKVTEKGTEAQKREEARDE